MSHSKVVTDNIQHKKKKTHTLPSGKLTFDKWRKSSIWCISLFGKKLTSFKNTSPPTDFDPPMEPRFWGSSEWLATYSTHFLKEILLGDFWEEKKSCEGIFEGDLIIKDSEKKNGSTVCTHLVRFLVVFMDEKSLKVVNCSRKIEENGWSAGNRKRFTK